MLLVLALIDWFRNPLPRNCFGVFHPAQPQPSAPSLVTTDVPLTLGSPPTGRTWCMASEPWVPRSLLILDDLRANTRAGWRCWHTQQSRSGSCPGWWRGGFWKQFWFLFPPSFRFIAAGGHLVRQKLETFDELGIQYDVSAITIDCFWVFLYW